MPTARASYLATPEGETCLGVVSDAALLRGVGGESVGGIVFASSALLAGWPLAPTRAPSSGRSGDRCAVQATRTSAATAISGCG